MRQSTYVWPHAFTRMDAPADVFLSRFGANHIHAVPGDMTAELAAISASWTWTWSGWTNKHPPSARSDHTS